jgi:NAD(P)-dependent dehydrogenase (short-subunit alcohol dehydrogenase family)
MNDQNTKIVLVTGASAGLGKVIAATLAAAGHTVYGTGRRQQPDADGVRMRMLDVTQPASIDQCVADVIAEAGKIDVLVNNAGEVLGGILEETDIAAVEAHFQTNFFGAVRMTHAVLGHMRPRRQGQIIFMSSLAGLIAVPGEGFYAAAKHALEGYAFTLALEVHRFNIAVSLVEPSFFKTDIVAKATHAPAHPIDDYDGVREHVRHLLVEGVEQGENPQKVADKVHMIVQAARPKLRYRVGHDAQIVPILAKFLPERLFLSVLRRHFTM